MINIVVYHRHCNDGSGAAAVAWSHLKGSDLQTVQFPCDYNNSVDLNKLYDLVRKQEVNRIYIVDFSFHTTVLNNLAANCEQVVVLDHHDSAIKRISTESIANNVLCILDRSRSGVMLTYDFFLGLRTSQKQEPSPIESYPDFVKLIGVRDLWLDNWMVDYPEARYLHASLLNEPLNAFVFAYEVEGHLSQRLANGRVAVETLDGIRESTSKNFHDFTWFLHGPGQDYEMLHVQLNFVPYAVISEHAEFEKDNYDCIITANFVDRDTVKLSFRSREDAAKRLALALNPEGGGHTKAAGCTITLEQFSRLCDHMNLYVKQEDSES